MTAPDPAQQQQPEQPPPDGGQQGQPPPTPGPGGKQQQEDLDAPKFSQRHYNDFEARTRREYATKADKDKALIEKGKEYEALLAESQPLSERVTAQAADISQRDGKITELEAVNLRQRLAWEAGLPPAIGRRVTGNTEDEIKADIEDLKKDLAPVAGQPGQGSGLRPNPQQGAPSPENNRTGSVSAGRDLWNQRHGKKADAAT